MIRTHRAFSLAAAAVCAMTAAVAADSFLAAPPEPVKTGSVIFVHPDGAGVAHWGAARIAWVGPDALLHWDRLPHLAVYRGHMLDAMAATSHGGATTHAYGVKVPADSYGMAHHTPLVALSGKPYSIMQEAREAGLAVGVVNSGNLNEPGTGCFLASSSSRQNSEEIVKQVLLSGADVIMGGGEKWCLPLGVEGRFGPGARTDGSNLIEAARERGYTVVQTPAELEAATDATKLLGVFAHDHTFHDEPEEVLRVQGLPLYEPEAPSVARMMRGALAVLERTGKRFLLVVEEEGTDNFANNNNAAGELEALRRGDEALGVAREHLAAHPGTLVLTAADSDASGMQVISPGPHSSSWMKPGEPLPPVTDRGAPLDGQTGSCGIPFVSAPDRSGRTHTFGIAWTGRADNFGGILLRADGLNAASLRGNADNTDVYRLMYLTLFGKLLP